MLEVDVCGLITDAITNMKRYWKDREHFVYIVEYYTGHSVEEITQPTRCGITIMKTVDKGENRWVMTIDMYRNAIEVGNAADIDGVWKWFEEMQAKYCGK